MFPDVANDVAAPQTRVKICGITNLADAVAALDCGADAIGVNLFRGSRRYVSFTKALEWLSELPPRMAVVAVMVNPTIEEAIEVANSPLVDGVQLHGQETTEFCRDLALAGVRFGKALPVIGSQSFDGANQFSTQTLILDAVSNGAFGGTGSTFPWELAAEYVLANPSMRVVLAGGLTPENVAGAVAKVHPFAVDVTSGVERAAGLKDHGLVRAFIAAVRGA